MAVTKKVTRKTTKRGTKTKKAVVKARTSSSKIMARCFACKKQTQVHEKFKLIKKKLKTGRVVTILCGLCSVCRGKVCRFIANEKGSAKRKTK